MKKQFNNVKTSGNQTVFILKELFIPTAEKALLRCVYK